MTQSLFCVNMFVQGRPSRIDSRGKKNLKYQKLVTSYETLAINKILMTKGLMNKRLCVRFILCTQVFLSVKLYVRICTF